ncbi:MAG TPA: DUF309 domain-containing protein [Allocoleopsis sp.]
MTEAVEPEFWLGVEQFNQRQFYACHDTLEAIWMEAMEPQKTFYQGIIQIAVALYHLSNQNLRGATILLGEGLNRLRRYPPTYAGVAVSELVNQSLEWLALLQQTQPEEIAELANLVIHGNPDDSSATGTLTLPRISRVEIP